MKMYNEFDIQCIVELFLAAHFNFASVDLKRNSIGVLREICESYGIEVENIQENN